MQQIYTAKTPMLSGAIRAMFCVSVAGLLMTTGTDLWRTSGWLMRAAFLITVVMIPSSIAQAIFRRTIFEDSRIVYTNTLGKTFTYPYSDVSRFLPMKTGKTKIWFADGKVIDLFDGDHDQKKVSDILLAKCPQLRVHSK